MNDAEVALWSRVYVAVSATRHVYDPTGRDREQCDAHNAAVRKMAASEADAAVAMLRERM